MGKKKQFAQSGSKQAPQGKKKQPEPRTEDDFLDAADEFEKAGGKWRAGDAAKATRFFQRAIDAYSAGLQKHPKSFDLAYNKALLEYQITQDMRIAAQFGPSLVDLLREALASHQFALSLDSSNTDILFNTAQTLSDLADRTPKAEAIPALREAVKLMRRCLERQVSEYEALEAAFQAANSDGESKAAAAAAAPAASPAGSASSSEEYATVEQAVTDSDVLDSAFALTHMVADLLSLFPADQAEAVRADVEFVVGFYASGVLTPYIERLDKTAPEPEPRSLSLSISAPNPQPARPQQSPYTEAMAEAALADAVLASAVAEIEFRRGEMPALTYYGIVMSKFAGAAASVDASCAMADALLGLAAATASPESERRAGEMELLSGNGSSDRDDKTAAGGRDPDAVDPTPVPADADASIESWSAEQMHRDTLHRAHHVLASTLRSGRAPVDKIPQLYNALGDVHWHLRNAHTCSQRDSDVARAEAAKAEAYWRLGAQTARQAGLACAEEEVEAGAKVRIAEVARGVAETGLAGRPLKTHVAETVGEMSEEGLLHGILADRVVSVL